tara:strand:+ start:66636 stop:66794 length:159 start_codon:yes stop_codon:yes gene_type:complete
LALQSGICELREPVMEPPVGGFTKPQSISNDSQENYAKEIFGWKGVLRELQL